jgi:hypothetical protein
MKISNMLHGAMLRYLHSVGISEAVKVTGYGEDTYVTGGCSTCATTEYEVDIYYTTTNGMRRIHTFNGRFGDLIRVLDEMTEAPGE